MNGKTRTCAACGASLGECDYRRKYCMSCSVERARLAKKMRLKPQREEPVETPKKSDEESRSRNSAKRQILAGWQEAFGRSWYDDHPGQEPTTDTDIMTEEALRMWKRTHGTACPPKCHPARWRAFLARCANPEKYEMAEEP